MFIKKISKLFIAALVFAFILGVADSASRSVSADVLRKTEMPAENGITGVWQLNPKLSDEAAARFGANVPQLPAPVLFAPKQLILASDELTNEITINEGFEKIIHTRTLPTDGSSISGSVEMDQNFTARAYWLKGNLVVEYQTPLNGKIVETFEPTDRRNQLKIVLRVEDPRLTQPLVINRVYDRMAVASDAGGDQSIEINLSENPL
ncbi:MAG: hypothetical protein R2747_24040 [Pyrinomonadaceae bacterium]